MPGRIKQLMFKEYQKALDEMTDMFAIRYTKLEVESANELRGKLFKDGNKLLHVRNRIFRKALEDRKLDDFGQQIDGPSAVVYGEDMISGIKAVTEFAKTNKGIELTGGYFDGQVMDPAGLDALSKIPPREVLLTQVMLAARGPVQGAASLLQNLMQKLVATVKEIENAKSA